MRNLKRLLSILLASVLTINLFACGAKTSTTASANTNDTVTNEVKKDDFKANILFCGSTSLYPILSSLASSFTEEYVTWDKVDSSFPNKNISIYVAPGGSGVGVSAAVDKTADFGMLARDIKEKEIEKLGKDYKDFVVAKDALTVSVNKENPITEKMDNMDTEK